MKVSIHFTIVSLIILISSWNSLLGERSQEKAKVRLNLEYFNSGTQERYLTAYVRTRIEKRYQPVAGVVVDMYLMEPTEASRLGKVISDEDGACRILLPQQFYHALDTLNEFIFIARLNDNPDYADQDVELTIAEVFLDLDFIDEDSLKLIHVTVLEKDSLTTRPPREEVEIKFLVERPFSRLPIGGNQNNIDEEGEVTIEFPQDLPGDSVGTVKVIVRIQDSELYGNVERNRTIDWGAPILFNDETIKRSLWAAGANAPVSLLVLVNSLILAVWGIIFYIVYKIFQIRRA